MALTLGLALALPSPSPAVIAGGGPAKSDCYGAWLVNSETFTITGNRLDCPDGDADCDADGQPDGKCTLNVGICVNQTIGSCTSQGVASVKPNKATQRRGIQAPPGLPTSSPLCGPTTSLVVPLRTIARGKNRGKKQPSKPVKLNFKAKATSGSPKSDVDNLIVRCVTPSTAVACPANPTGPSEPNEIRLTVVSAGTDLDNGWRGASQNFPTPADTKFQLCLQNCDTTTDAECDVVANTGAGTFNGETFGPPLPLITASVPVCVLNRYRRPQFTGGRANFQTGEVVGPIELASAVYLTETNRVCPKCESGKCDSGPNVGKACKVDGTVTVAQSTAANKTFRLSKDCPPDQSAPSGPPLNINLGLTTGTSTLSPLPGGNAATPCVKQGNEPTGLQPQPDLCPAGGTCTAPCSGLACATQGVDYVTGAQVCVDSKGGISQFCCSNATSLPCFPTGPGSIGKIERTGKPLVPQPVWPDPTYPKKTDCAPGACLVQVATFCEAATGGNSVDGLTGLPGPGTLTLPVTTLWLKP
jgi:hypothetical protein